MPSEPFSRIPARFLLALSGAALLLWAWAQTTTVEAGQAARAWSRPGQEDFTFWTHHDGLIDMHLEGEVGYGDVCRLLMRRRSNAPLMRKVRDRFTSPVRDLTQVRTPDLFRVAISDAGIAWENRPESFVVGANRMLNLPLAVENRTGRALEIQARFLPSSGVPQLESTFDPSPLDAKSSAGYFLEVLETEPGAKLGRLRVQAGEHALEAEVRLDVRPLVPLRVHLLDEDGRPAVARVYLTAADGLAYTPPGLVSRITAMSSEYYFHADGSFEIELPGGPTVVEATRGLEYGLGRAEIDLQPGKPQEVRLRLKRWENMAAKGWYSSDAHIHANYTAPHHQVIEPEDVRLQAFGEDLNNANLMVANSSASFLHDLRYFEGKPHALSGPNHILYWNEEMRNAGPYGHMCFYGLKQLVSPLYTGFAGTPFWEDYPPNYTQARNAREQGGAVTYAHPIGGSELKPDSARVETTGRLHPPSVPVSFETAGVKELPVDLALGQVDAFDVFSNADEIGSMEIWYGLLNCGFRLGISAGSDSFTNVVDHYTAGGGRVYVHSGGRLDYQQWIQGYKQGRSFATNGPMLFFTVNGKEPGEEIRLAPSARGVRVSARVRTQVPIEKIEVIANGQVVASRDASGGNEISLDEDIALRRSSWIALRAYGPWHRLVLNDLQTLAHTSPVYVRLGDQPIASRDEVRYYIDWIEKLIAQVKSRGRFANDARRQEVVELFGRALDQYRKIEQSAVAD